MNVFLRNHIKSFICRRSLNSYTSEIMLMIHKPNCENYDITTIRTSIQFHFHWKNHFHKNPLYFRFYADLEADNEMEDSEAVCKKNN